MTTSTVHSRLEKFREKLLDLTKRNRLLNFRPTRASTVRVVDELPAEVFHLLVQERKSLSFVPAPAEDAPQEEVAREGDSAGDLPAPEGGPETSEDAPPLPAEAGPDVVPDDTEVAPESTGGDVEPPLFSRHFQPYRREQLEDRHRDRWLQTRLEPERLDHNLLRVYQQAGSALEEHGYNILFLALGALEWFDRDEPGRTLLAPVLLVPVELKRRSPRSPFFLEAADDDPLVNPALAMMLEREMRITAPALPEDLDNWDLQELFSALAESVSAAGWRVVNDVNLGLFSFTKFIMYKDLESCAEQFAENRLIRALCGERLDPEAEGDGSEDGDAGQLDELLDPATTFQVLDADSSQQQAIRAVKNGRNLVLEGPPGTGKSQTITNIIAECLAANKRVLFVSEKMAALEVVYGRLRDTGLADFCLELHSRHASKRQVAEELGRTLELSRSRPPRETDETLAKLRTLRQSLNDYVDSLSSPLEPLGMSPFEAMGEAAALEDASEVPATLPPMERWTREELNGAVERLLRLEGARHTVGERYRNIDDHPWRGSRLEELSYRDSVALRDHLDQLSRALATLEESTDKLARSVSDPGARSCRTAEELARLARLLASSPRPTAESVMDPAWSPPAEEPARLIRLVRRFVEVRSRLARRWSPELLERRPEGLLEEERRSRGVLRLLRPSWWRHRSVLRSLLGGDSPLPERSTLLDDLEQAVEAHRVTEEIDSASDRGALLFGRLWRGVDSDPDALQHLADWMESFRPHVRGESAGRRVQVAVDGPAFPEEVRERAAVVTEDLRVTRECWERLREAARLDEEKSFGGSFDEQEFTALTARCGRMSDDVEALHDWGRLVSAEKACRHAGLDRFLDACAARGLPPAAIEPAFRRLFFHTWLDHAFDRRPVLRRFGRNEHERRIQEFRELDLAHIGLARKRLRARLRTRLPDSTWEPAARSELGILQREVRRKRGHKPLRQLFQLIPNALARLKPCFLMSPLSVAQFLDPALQRFDVVIFDEASQISPEDAIGAIARGSQLVVVGDSRQLPPTAFFQSQGLLADDGSEPEETPELESILDECAVADFPGHMLRWHYRSRHESLITFSNAHFYQGKLHTFPHSHPQRSGLGVRLVHLPDAVYDRGKSQTNRAEAERVAEAVLEHFRTHPELSLGVGTFSLPQQMAVLDRLEELRREDESLEEFFSPERPEHFFVKNLENIQGDERDVIFLSVGYGRDATGRLHLNFGPINKAGGERRLNVLVTRARRSLTIFSSIRGQDIDESRIGSVGGKLLKSYLEYAENGQAGSPATAPEEAARTDRRSVARALEVELRKHGLPVEPLVGCSALRVDLAVRAADADASYLLGLECDGESYQACDTARDRDRLRQQVLEGLGWRLHRVWSTEWYRNSRFEVERVLAAVESARRGELPAAVLPLLESRAPPPPEDAPGERQAPRAGDRQAPRPDGPVSSYILAHVTRRGEPDEFEEAGKEIETALVEVVEVEAPIHIDEAARRVALSWGITRLGRAVQAQMARTVEAVSNAGTVKVKDQFLWLPEQVEPFPRRRDGAGVPREPDLIALEEIGAAALLVLEREFRLGRKDLTSQVARLFGFQRTGSKLRARIGAGVDRLLAAGRAIATDGWISPAGASQEPDDVK